MDNVDDYNDRLRDNDFPESRLFMINNNLDRNIPKGNAIGFSTGGYNMKTQQTEIGNASHSKYPISNTHLASVLHEGIHAIQDDNNDLMDYSGGKDYYSQPIELHARAATINQLYTIANNSALDNTDKIDTLLQNIESVKNLQVDKSDTQGVLTYKDYLAKSRHRVSSNDEYKKKLGTIHPDILKLYNEMYNSQAVQKYIKDNPNNPNAGRDAIKALIMTTAKNENSIKQQNNSAIDMGWEVS